MTVKLMLFPQICKFIFNFNCYFCRLALRFCVIVLVEAASKRERRLACCRCGVGTCRLNNDGWEAVIPDLHVCSNFVDTLL